jgi:hypothetical protein
MSTVALPEGKAIRVIPSSVPAVATVVQDVAVPTSGTPPPSKVAEICVVPPPPPPPPTAAHAEPLYRQVAKDVPPPEHVPVALASVKTYTEPVAGELGGLANVEVGGIQFAPRASTRPVCTRFCLP